MLLLKEVNISFFYFKNIILLLNFTLYLLDFWTYSCAKKIQMCKIYLYPLFKERDRLCLRDPKFRIFSIAVEKNVSIKSDSSF